MYTSLLVLLVLSVLSTALAAPASQPAPGSQPSSLRKTVIPLDIPGPDDSAGGLLVADCDNDGRMDFLVTVPAHLAVYSNDGKKLWVHETDIIVDGQSESKGLPGHHGPGAAAGDIDGDGKCEVIYLTRDGTLHIVEGATGKAKATAKPPVPEGAVRWEQAMIANLRGKGDRDILLQATNATGYRTGKYLAAYAIDDLLAGRKPLWTTDAFAPCAHNGARLADIDGDGRDEILGAGIFRPDGTWMVKPASYEGHIDSVFVADVRPERKGLEVVILEEGRGDSNGVQLLAGDGPIWRSHLRRQEPQNAAVGRFREGSDEMLVWCRSRYNEHQKPFVFDAKGEVVAEYSLDDVAPPGWTASGVEVIHTIDWTGQRHQLACAKERHRSGDVCVFEPLSGRFVLRISEKADRLYVADVFGDWREEIIVLAGSALHIYQNEQPNPRPSAKSLWDDRNYRKMKQCHNYYSP
jgi:hypothetical protein